MEDWKSALDSPAGSGVYRVAESQSREEIAELSARHGLCLAVIGLHSVVDKEGLLREIASALEFPDYFGMNWDALNDCLTDMSWKQADGYVLFFEGFQVFAEAAEAEAEVAMQILGVAAEFWRHQGVPFYALLSD
jgi:hypothetical protein